MSFLRQAAKGGLWLSLFKFITQVISWASTIIIARILLSSDYGLMAMASLLTGYIEVFAELGIGSAIIQRKIFSQELLSSIFWATVMIGVIFFVLSIGLAYPTAWIFNEPRIIPITQLIAVLFIINSLMIVPYSLLSRDVRFKEIGMIQLAAITVQSISMLIMAYKGFGVWTLIFGTVIHRMANVLLSFKVSGWRPLVHFRFGEIKAALHFGMNIAGARSLQYAFSRVDKFIIGKYYNAQYLGYYSFAMQLAGLPTDKIVSTVQQVVFPVFAEYQNNILKVQDIYLRTTKHIVLIVSPMFMCGFLWGDQLVTVILGSKWIAIIPMFKLFCVVYLIMSINTINTVMQNALGKVRQVLVFTLALAIMVPLSIFIAAQKGFIYTIIPWITIYPALCVFWTWITLTEFAIPKKKYFANISYPVMASLVAMLCAQEIFNYRGLSWIDLRIVLMLKITVSTFFYMLYLFVFERETIKNVMSLRNNLN